LELQNNYTYVIADCAGHADINGRSALTVSDIAIIPVLPSSLSLFTIESTLNSCIDAQTLNPKLKIIIVLTNCHSNRLVKDTQEARDTILESIEGVSNFKLADTQITSRKVWIDIVAEGKGITESNNLQAIEEFKKLMSEVF
jgi:chromosome partitioning protein